MIHQHLDFLTAEVGLDPGLAAEASDKESPVRTCAALILILSALTIALLSINCGETLVDCAIFGTVVDAATGAPIDSARVYVTYIGYPPPSGERHLGAYTHKNGGFSIFPVGCKGFHMIDVEKEGYLPARQIVQGSDPVVFELEKGILPPLGNAEETVE